MLISELTRRNIIDELRVRSVCWHGRLDELGFIKRIFDIKSLPSNDGRFQDMEGDFWQHRVNNYDWEDDWIYEDDRLNLMRCEDQVFLKFLCEMINPIVRSDSNEVQNLLEIFNNHLEGDFFKLDVEKTISKKPIFHAIKIDAISVTFENKKMIGRSFVGEQLKKCETKLAQNDFDGAITNARSLLEDVIARDIYKQIAGKEMQTKGDLIQDYKVIKKLLNLVENKQLDDSFKQVTVGLSSIVNGLSSIGNKMGDRHSREIKPERHHAKLAINAAKTICDFLYDVLDYQKTRIETLRTEMMVLPYVRYGEGSCYYGKCHSIKTRDELLKQNGYSESLLKCDPFIKRLLLNDLMSNFQIKCFDDADRFFINLVLFFDNIESSDIQQVYKKTKDDGQANFKLLFFLEETKEVKPDFLTKAMKDFIESKNN